MHHILAMRSWVIDDLGNIKPARFLGSGAFCSPYFSELGELPKSNSGRDRSIIGAPNATFRFQKALNLTGVENRGPIRIFTLCEN